MDNIRLDKYILEEELERGDLTVIYRARRKTDDARVAIKVVAPQFTFDELFVHRFKDVAKQSAKLEHPNIVRTYEVGQEGDVLYMVRELIDACPLADILDAEGPFAPRRMLTIVRQVAAALDYSHQKSITHGDLAANRVFVGANDDVVVADFGQTQAMAGTGLVKQGFAVGAPETMAPERIHGQGPTRQSDLYSLGVLSYQMLVNAPPFTGSPAAVLHAQAYEQPRALHLVNPEISVPVSEAVSRMLSKGLELRYNTGAEFARALAVAVEGTAPVRSPAAAAAQIKDAGLEKSSLWKRPWLWVLIGLPFIILLLVVGFGGISIWSAGHFAAEPTPTLVVELAPTITTVSQTETQTPAEEVPAVTSQPAPTSESISDSTVTPAATVTPLSLPTPGAPTVAQGSPFTNLQLARNISSDNKPENVNVSFVPGTQPVYLFFDYGNMQPGVPWAHRWTWGDTELDVYPGTWPDSYSSRGTAWVYYSPTGGFQPGPYKVSLEVDGQIVATATFVIESP
jgi:serine/threonine-protein kinase